MYIYKSLAWRNSNCAYPICATGIFALVLRDPRRGLPDIPVAGELLQNVGRDRAEHIQHAGDPLPHAQAEGLPFFAREQLGHKSDIHVQHVPYPVSDEPGEKTLRLRAVLLQATR